MGVPYTFGTATTSIPLSNLDANFNTPITLGNTTVGLGNTATTVSNLTLSNVTITSGTINAAVVDSGYVANSVVYANSTGILTSGSANFVFDGTNVGIGTSSPTFTAGTGLQVKGSGFTNVRVSAGSYTGLDISQTNTSGASYVYLRDNAPLIFGTNDTERMRIDSSGNVGIGTSSPADKFSIYGDSTDKVSAYVENNNSAGSAGADKRLNLVMGGSSAFGITGWQNAGVIEATSTGGLWLGAYNGALKFATGSSARTERMRITSTGDIGVGTTNPKSVGNYTFITTNATTGSGYSTQVNGTEAGNFYANSSATVIQEVRSANMIFETTATERMRINSSGFVLMGKTTTGLATNGVEYEGANGGFLITRGGNPVLLINRNTDDGTLVEFRQDNSTEGSISVSGSTVSYNGGHLSRWSQLPNNQKDDTLLKGTVMSNLDDMCVWVKDGETLPNEQLNKMKVSDVEGDTNVAGVFVDWQFDEQCQSDDMNVAMTGDMIIRIAQGVVVQKGDLLMSAGDGTAKPQGDDIVRSKTVAKVTSNHVTCTYADGSYCVPCVLMAC